MGVAHLLEVARNLYFHVVRYSLVFLYARIEFCKRLVIFLSKQFAHHSEHALNARAEECNFFLRLKNSDFWSLDDTALDVHEALLFFLFVLLRLDDVANEFLYLWYEPNENAGVYQVEAGMESRKHKT